MTTHRTRYTRRLHERRNGTHIPEDIASSGELTEAWRSLQLHWLHSVPGYRELIKRRVSEVRRVRTEQPEGYCRLCLAEIDGLALPPHIERTKRFCSERCRKSFWIKYEQSQHREIDGCG